MHVDEAALGVYVTSDFYVYAGETGNDSVVMPADAVSAIEIENEPGVAATFSMNSTNIPFSPPTTVVNATISAPTDGYVLAVGVVAMDINHDGGATITTCSISETMGVIDPDCRATVSLNSFLASGRYRFPISLARVIPVSPGPHQFNIVCSNGGYTSVDAEEPHLNLLFVPTAYGTVSTKTTESSGNATGAPSTQADVEAEKAESIAFNLARIQAELDAIQARADALAAEVDQ